MKVKMSRLRAGDVFGPNPLRTDTVEGVLLEPILLGKGVKILGNSLTPGMTARLVHTSDVVELTNPDEGKTVVYTKSGSIYEIEEMESQTK